ncbi:MAG: PDC sensor domain-containing protein, partial [Clostridia bacterium]|nr:PDC sensor domain-containing protein [Clostridia bacterium]
MKNKFVMIIGLVMIILAIGFRAICYFFLDRALLDRDDVFKNNNEKILFYELYGIIDDVELNLENIKESDLKEICYESSKQDATNKLIKIKAGIDKVSSIYIALNDGHLIATNITNGFSVTETERWYQETLKTRKSVICSRENNEGNPTFMVTVPLYIEGTFRGVIGGEINSETIKKIINNYTDNPYQLLLKDSQNEILYRHTRNTNLTRNIDQRIFYMPQADDAVTFDKHNFKIEVYYNENEALQAVMPVKIVFSILSIIVIISYITTLFNTRANSDFIKCSFILFVLTIFEWFGAAFLITTRYDEDLLKMLESLKAHMAYTEDIFNDVSDEIYGTFTNIFNKDGVVSDEDK